MLKYAMNHPPQLAFLLLFLFLLLLLLFLVRPLLWVLSFSNLLAPVPLVTVFFTSYTFEPPYSWSSSSYTPFPICSFSSSWSSPPNPTFRVFYYSSCYPSLPLALAPFSPTPLLPLLSFGTLTLFLVLLLLPALLLVLMSLSFFRACYFPPHPYLAFLTGFVILSLSRVYTKKFTSH